MVFQYAKHKGRAGKGLYLIWNPRWVSQHLEEDKGKSVKDIMQLDYSNLQPPTPHPKKTSSGFKQLKPQHIEKQNSAELRMTTILTTLLSVCTSFLFHMNDTKQTLTKDDPNVFMLVLQLKHTKIFLKIIGRRWWYKFTYREFGNWQSQNAETKKQDRLLSINSNKQSAILYETKQNMIQNNL